MTGMCKRGLARRDDGWRLQGTKWVGLVLLVASDLANNRVVISGLWMADRRTDGYSECGPEELDTLWLREGRTLGVEATDWNWEGGGRMKADKRRGRDDAGGLEGALP